ncbi:MAG: hypothetical protein JW913_18300 [Chitinispirillaceae bacterium]|nr:hypothetical protein [Chitinispirillaceae bacterium]
MIFLRRLAIAGLMTGLIMVTATPAEQGEQDTSKIRFKKLAGLEIRPFGMGSFEFGQIVHGQYRRAPAPHISELYRYWMEKTLLQIGLEAKQDNGLDILLAGEGMLYFPYALPDDGSNGGFDSYLPRFNWYIHYALAQYAFGDPEKPYLNIGAGFFPFKYNPDGHNFGDYLFRTSSYPQYFPTSFDTPYQRLVGLHLNGWITKRFKHDLLLTSEIYLWPLRDFSLTYLCDGNLFDIAHVGIGIMGHKLISVDNSLTTPPASYNPNHFTSRSIKTTFMLSINPKRFITSDFFGEKDLRLYTEQFVNGWENYPINDSTNARYPGYDDVAKRVISLYGFNWPTHPLASYTVIPGVLAFFYNGSKINGPTLVAEGAGIISGVGMWLLERFVDKKFRPDVISIEAERWKNDFANSYTIVFLDGYASPPEPVKYSNSGHLQPYGGPWHWSIFAEKTILDRLSFKAQIARDHSVIQTARQVSSTGDPQEAMDGIGNWGWMFKIQYGF